LRNRRVSGAEEARPSGRPDPGDAVQRAAYFRFRAGFPDRATQTLKVGEIALVPDELKGSENLVFNEAIAVLQECDQFFDVWHHAQIQYDLSTYTGSVWIDGQPILSNVPLNTELRARAYPEISVQGGGDFPVKLWLDDLAIKLKDKGAAPHGTEEPALQTLVKEDFNKYESMLFPMNGGWTTRQDIVANNEQGTSKRVNQDTEGGFLPPANSPLAGKGAAAFVDKTEYASKFQSFEFAGGEEGAAYAAKRISLPLRVPFAVSEENFIIVKSAAGQHGNLIGRDSGISRAGRKFEKGNPTPSGSGTERAPFGKDSSSGQTRQNRTNPTGLTTESGNTVKAFSVSPAGGSYYIYSFDGKLLAEYNTYGVCVRDYVYMGGKLIAEYNYLSSQYYYYTSDQINSTKIVTDGTGAVVYAAALDPYGGIQNTWVNTFDPTLKFSGKERDGESGLDYFGARYFDKTQYRFISVDPRMRSGLPEDSQSLNLYSYCGNNPESFLDSNGAIKIYCVIYWSEIPKGSSFPNNYGGRGRTILTAWDVSVLNHSPDSLQELLITLTFNVTVLARDNPLIGSYVGENSTYGSIVWHEMRHISNIVNYVLSKGREIENDWLSGKITWQEVIKRVEKCIGTAISLTIWAWDKWEWGEVLEAIQYMDPSLPFWQYIMPMFDSPDIWIFSSDLKDR
jgi:RHS repeat-associated protein